MTTRKIKKGDTVLVMKGKNRTKRGKVLRVWPQLGKITIEGVNEKIRHTRPKRQGKKGERVTVLHPIPEANVRVVCSSCGKGTRVGFKINDGQKSRICKKCGADL